MPKKIPITRKPPEGLTRPPMERMWRIHQMLSKDTWPNCTGLSRELEVSPKTVMRDLEFMRDRLGLPLEYDAVRHGYYYTAPVRDFPTMKVSQGEVAALLLAQKSVEQFRGTQFEKPLTGAFRKLSQSLGGEMEVTWHELEQAMSVRRSGVGLADMQIFHSLAQAVTNREEVELSYHKLAGEKSEKRIVHPYHLGCIEDQWYLFAHDAGRGAIRTFALPRIGSVERTGAKFRRPNDFSVGKMLEGSFAVFEGGNAKKVKILFQGVATRLVAERSWHESQRIARRGTRTELSMQVGLSPDLVQWILGWGADAEVLSPPELRERVARAAAAAAGVYRRATDTRSGRGSA